MNNNIYIIYDPEKEKENSLNDFKQVMVKAGYPLTKIITLSSIEFDEYLDSMKFFHIKFKGVDDFHRPVYKVVDKNIYFGSTSILWGDPAWLPSRTKEEANDFFRARPEHLELFGSSFNCEPMGGFSKKWRIKIID